MRARWWRTPGGTQRALSNPIGAGNDDGGRGGVECGGGVGAGVGRGVLRRRRQPAQ